MSQTTGDDGVESPDSFTPPEQPAGFVGGLESVRPCETSVDSAAEESVRPREGLTEVLAVTTGVERKRFVAANGQEMGHYGRKVVQFRRKGCPSVLTLGCDVTEVTRSLVVAARRVVQKRQRRRARPGGREARPQRQGGRRYPSSFGGVLCSQR